MLKWQDVSKGCVKGFLIALNVLCILTALCTFGFAVVDTKILKQYGEKQAQGSLTGDIVIIVICVVLVGIALLGCTGAVRDDVKLLYKYVICVMILIVLELLVAIYVSVQRYDLQYRVSQWLQEDFYGNMTRDEKQQHDHEKLWEELQSSYFCCGLNGPEDYEEIGQPISISCCARAYRARTATAQAIMYKTCLESSTYYTDGCEDEILETLKADADWLFGVVISSFWFEVMGMLLAMWLANFVKNSVQVYKHTVKY